MAGRPTSLTPERQEKILNALRAGNYRVAACKWADVDISTFVRWMKRGSQGEEPFAQFAAQVKQAEAHAEASLVATIRKAASDTWQAAAWLLERKYTTRWGRRDLSWERMQREQRNQAQAQLAEISLEDLEAMVLAERAKRAKAETATVQ